MPATRNATVHTSPEAASEHMLRRISLCLGLIVVGLAIALCFVARMLFITTIVAAFLAILAEPAVTALARMRIRFTWAAAIVVICGVILVGSIAYGAYRKAGTFASKLPMYSLRLQQALQPVVARIERLQQDAESLSLSHNSDGITEIKVREATNWSSFMVRGVGSISNGLIMAGVIPFLCFFMLTRKDPLYRLFESVFPNRVEAAKFAVELGRVIRGFVVGNLMVALIMAGATAVVFYGLGINNPVALGIIVALVNLIPVVGVVAAVAVGVAAGLVQFSTWWPFAVLVPAILALHVISQNVLIPRIIGTRVNVGPVAVIVGMLFWGWLWGAAGLLLAVPLIAVVKLILETQPSLGHLSDIMAASPRPPDSRLRRACIRQAQGTYVSPEPGSAVPQ